MIQKLTLTFVTLLGDTIKIQLLKPLINMAC